MKNNLSDLNNHLFLALERLNNEDLQGEELNAEIRRDVAITGVAEQVINNASTVLKAYSLKDNLNIEVLPEMIEAPKKRS